MLLLCSCAKNPDEKKDEKSEEIKAVSLEYTKNANPLTGFDSDGNLIYGGDPAAMVDGDTVYLYTGHDVATDEAYNIPEWQCYSSKDLKDWNYEGVILSCQDITWADKKSAWAAQTIKHYDKEAGKDRYYFYFCSWDSTSEGKQSIGVAVADSPAGPFEDIGKPIVKGTVTTGESSGWNDIDPTVWIDTDENGEEHRYLCWGNGKNYVCELNEDMISVKDYDGDGNVTFGKDIIEKKAPESYTEAPWLYRRQDENGKYYGDYYLFYAYGWREQMAYATTDDLMKGEWKFGDVIMEPSATSNTNHMSVIDFEGETYFIYHNGCLPKGSGFRRVANIERMEFDENGKISYIPETALGIGEGLFTIADGDGKLLSHKAFQNSTNDKDYPYMGLEAGFSSDSEKEDALWAIVPGKDDPDNENYVSIESNNKPGLYLTVVNKAVRMSQDVGGNLGKAQTFRTVSGLNGKGVSFESVLSPGMYLTNVGENILKLTDGKDAEACTFFVEKAEQ